MLMRLNLHSAPPPPGRLHIYCWSPFHSPVRSPVSGQPAPASLRPTPADSAQTALSASLPKVAILVVVIKQGFIPFQFIVYMFTT